MHFIEKRIRESENSLTSCLMLAMVFADFVHMEIS